MATSGPPPNPNSRKQSGNQAHTWRDLPAGGYDGEIPDWPLFEVTDPELAMWRRVWRTPHAAAWAQLEWTDDVAMYVRYFLLGAAGDLKAATESRQWNDRLGLNPTAMLKNRWRIKADDVAAKRETKKPAKKRRFKVVDDAVAGG